jgi:catechol 2,3-dioxygenase-like lactoylglutathione lyase family enzyme
MITDVGHTAFRVHDLQKSIEFYALLGIHEKFRLNHPDGSLMLAYLHVGGDRFIDGQLRSLVPDLHGFARGREDARGARRGD